MSDRIIRGPGASRIIRDARGAPGLPAAVGLALGAEGAVFTAGQVLMGLSAPGALTVTDALSKAFIPYSSPTPAGATAVFSLRKNGAAIGTATFSNGSRVGVVALSGGTQTLAAGDYVDVAAPASPDAALTGATITLAG
jgi:hypothetical protein